MKSSTKDKIRGKMHEIKGQVKQAIGEAANKPALATDGRNEKLAGKLQAKVGQVKKAFGK
jgi:uncharacterized protein YjbJ (UPF0337 family)